MTSIFEGQPLKARPFRTPLGGPGVDIHILGGSW